MSHQVRSVEPLGPHERSVLDDWLRSAVQAGIDVDDAASIGRAYDEYVAQVQATAPAQREDPTPTCTMFGMALGEHVVRRTALRWNVVTDTEGTDLAICTTDGSGVLFPVDPVAHHWEEQVVGWLPQWADELVETLARRSR